MNLSELLAIPALIVPNRTATISKNRRSSYVDLESRSQKLAMGLVATVGLAPGDRVLWMDVNSDKQAEAFFGIARADGVSVPINYRFRDDELAFAIENSGASVLFVGDQYLGSVADMLYSQAGRFSLLKRIVAIEGDPPDGWLTYESLLRSVGESTPLRDTDDLAMILYTSGTTGRPKGVMLSHDGLTSYPLENVTPADTEFEQRALLSVPLYHVAGVQVLFASIYGGRTLVVESQFDPTEWLRLVEEERVTRATIVPTMLKMAMDHPDFDKRDLSSLEILTYGAAPMPQDLVCEAIQRLPAVRFINAFGQTETGATITALPPEDHDLTGSPDLVAKRIRRLTSIGLPLDDVEVRLIAQDGSEVPNGEVGEIVARGPRLMLGYWNDEANTAEALQDGWLRTGDIGRIDEDGYVYLVDRARDFIKRGGEMISPQEVERTLREHPSIQDAAVIGIPDSYWGESVRAVVVTTRGDSPSEKELIEHCRSKLASFKKPESIVVVEKLPRNELGKVLKKQLREEFEQLS